MIPQKRIQGLDHHTSDGRIVGGRVSLDSFSQPAGYLNFEFFGRIGALIGGALVFHLEILKTDEFMSINSILFHFAGLFKRESDNNLLIFLYQTDTNIKIGNTTVNPDVFFLFVGDFQM